MNSVKCDIYGKRFQIYDHITDLKIEFEFSRILNFYKCKRKRGKMKKACVHKFSQSLQMHLSLLIEFKKWSEMNLVVRGVRKLKYYLIFFIVLIGTIC